MTKLNTELFTKKAKEIWGDKYDYSLVEYVSARDKVKIIYQDWIFEQSPDNHLRGKECEKRWDTERFIHEAKKIHGDKYDYSLVQFKNMNTHISLLLNGKIYEQTPYKHLMGREIEKGIKLKNTEEFIMDARKVWGDKYDYSLVDYTGCFNPIKIIFKNKIYEQTPTQHLMKMRCERNTIKNQDDFLKKCKEKHGDKYDYSLVEYKGIEKKVKIIYEGKIFEQKAGAHLYAGLVEKRILTRTTESFIHESNNTHDYKYDYSKVVYVNNHNKVIIICPIHGEFLQRPSSHLKGHGCNSCMESKGEKEICRFLKKHKINFIREHRFDECRGKKYKLPFDFYLPSFRTCIEFDGIQHFKPLPFFGGEQAFESLKINDKIKQTYCEDNFIELIRIRFDQEDNISSILWNSLKNKMKLKKRYQS
jgi:hypothetical protein